MIFKTHLDLLTDRPLSHRPAKSTENLFKTIRKNYFGKIHQLDLMEKSTSQEIVAINYTLHDSLITTAKYKSLQVCIPLGPAKSKEIEYETKDNLM